MTFAQLEEKFKTSLDNGLTFKDADFRFDRDGPNTFTPPKQTPNWLILLKGIYTAIKTKLKYFHILRTYRRIRLDHVASCLR